MFISDFLPHMTRLKTLKIEGGIPRDEKREAVQVLAAHGCLLEKLVIIGVSSPIGNSWGLGGQDVDTTDEDPNMPFQAVLEDENKEAIIESCSFGPPQLPSSLEYRPTYGWPPSPPLLHTIALHRSTITELKLCGYVGSPVFHKPTAITPCMLHPLKYFTNLKTLILSSWLMTFFDHDSREREIIRYWIDQRESTSTALAIVAPAPVQPTGSLPTIPYQAESTLGYLNPWQDTLQRLYSPSALARGVHKLIAPHLAPAARERGVDVRISFCIGVETTDIFDFDVVISSDDQPQSWTGPREEGEKERWWGKLNARQWF